MLLIQNRVHHTACLSCALLMFTTLACTVIPGLNDGGDTGGAPTDTPGGAPPAGAAPSGDDGSDDPPPRDPTGGPGGGGGDPSRLPPVDLNGFWLESNGREVEIRHAGNEIYARYVKLYLCDRDRGPVPPGAAPAPGADIAETEFDFEGELSGDLVEGHTSVCVYGHDEEDDDDGEDGNAEDFDDGSQQQDGIERVPVRLRVSADGNTLTGNWSGAGGSGSFTVTRQPCPFKYAEDFGLGAHNQRTQYFDDDLVIRNDGSVDAVPAGYELNPATDGYVRRAAGIDYTSNDAEGNQTSLEFTAGYHGVAHDHGSLGVISVTLDNGNTVYYHHVSESFVDEGQRVTPDTVIGKTGNTGALPPEMDIHLHVEVVDPNDRPVDPADCAAGRDEPRLS